MHLCSSCLFYTRVCHVFGAVLLFVAGDMSRIKCLNLKHRAMQEKILPRGPGRLSDVIFSGTSSTVLR